MKVGVVRKATKKIFKSISGEKLQHWGMNNMSSRKNFI